MKKPLLTLFAATISLLVAAQDPDISWGAISQSSSTDAIFYPLGWHKDAFYTLRIDDDKGYLLRTDKATNIKSEPQLVTGEKDFEAELAMIHNGKLLLINSNYEKSEKAYLVRAWIFGLDGKPTSTKMKTIATITVEKNSEATDLSYRISPDSSKILITMDHNMPNKEDAKFTQIVINTADLKEVSNNASTVPYSDTDFALLSTAISNSGNIVTLATIKGGDGKRLQVYSTRAFVFQNGSAKYNDRELKIENKYISSAFIEFTGEGQLMISGFYNALTSKGKNEGIEGAFIASSELDGLADIDLKVMEVNPTLKASLAPQSGFAKFLGADELNAYTITDIHLRADGSGYVIAEQRLLSINYSSNLETRTAYFNSLIVYAFDPALNIQWISTIPKVQYSSGSSPILNLGIVSIYTWTYSKTLMLFKYNSYQDVDINGTIHIIYNDHRDNGNAVSISECKAMSNKKNANAVVVSIDDKGDWEKTTLFAGKETDVILESSSCYPMDGEGFTISCERGKNLQLGLLKLK